MYGNYDEFRLLLTKAQGSKFERVQEAFVDSTQEHFKRIADKFCEKTGCIKIEHSTLHWISHVNIDFFVHMLTHEVSEEMALLQIEPMIRYMIGGWKTLFIPQKN